jgi:hypothetical protein
LGRACLQRTLGGLSQTLTLRYVQAAPCPNGSAAWPALVCMHVVCAATNQLRLPAQSTCRAGKERAAKTSVAVRVRSKASQVGKIPAPWLMMVLSRATTGRPVAKASCTDSRQSSVPACQKQSGSYNNNHTHQYEPDMIVYLLRCVQANGTHLIAFGHGQSRVGSNNADSGRHCTVDN